MPPVASAVDSSGLLEDLISSESQAGVTPAIECLDHLRDDV